MRKSSYQFATDAEISYLLEKALNAGPEDTDNVKVISYLNSLCLLFVGANDLPNQSGFYNSVCERYVFNF